MAEKGRFIDGSRRPAAARCDVQGGWSVWWLANEELAPDYNMPPTKEAPVVMARKPKDAQDDASPERQLRDLTWGFYRTRSRQVCWRVTNEFFGVTIERTFIDEKRKAIRRFGNPPKWIEGFVHRTLSYFGAISEPGYLG